MSRKKRHSRVEVEGLVCHADDDPIADVAIATDYGAELPVDPGGPFGSPLQWIDSVVRAWGKFVMRDGRRYLQIDRVQDVNEEFDFEATGHEYNWDLGEYCWDESEFEHEDRY